MTLFKNPEPVDKFLFWFYLAGAAVTAAGGWVIYSGPPIIDACGNVGNNHAAGLVCELAAAIVLVLAENRRSGWFFWM